MRLVYLLKDLCPDTNESEHNQGDYNVGGQAAVVDGFWRIKFKSVFHGRQGIALMPGFQSAIAGVRLRRDR